MSTAESAAAAAPPPSEEVLNVNVGILGHVDSGKTSLVKTLSTLLSTAALDKSKQSRQRGMTLDLGFSCFFLDLPPHLKQVYPHKSKLQMTLVDCPGHASLIRTIIGGAQIIDIVLLVVDAYKGWQAQTTECLVLAELTSPNLIIALNKVDMFPEAEREERIQQAKNKIQQRLANSKFPDAIMVGVSACVGGEKVAATSTNTANQPNTTHNIDALVQNLQSSLPIPHRNPAQAKFYFAIDHCFPIKGMGTVLTGTCLSGHAKVNDTIEFPTLGRLQRKIKSMQTFKRKTMQIQQGDRAGICVSSLDSNLLERGVAAAPKAVHLLKGAIALVRKIPYYPQDMRQKQKFHISVGHATIMATVTFWGAQELAEQLQQQQQQATTTTATTENTPNLDGSALGGDADRAGLPYLTFDWSQDFMQQDYYVEKLAPVAHHNGDSATSTDVSSDTTAATSTSAAMATTTTRPELPLQWALIDFQTPIYCPLNSLIIGSRLDTVDNSNSSNNAASATNSPTTATPIDAATAASSCRLAFCGRLVEAIDPSVESSRIRLYTPKSKQGVISRLGEPHKRQDDGKIVRYEVFGGDLFKKETILKPFLGMRLQSMPTGDIGELKGAFGTSGKFRVYFPGGTEAREGDKLILPFKRFANDPEKKMRQEDWVLPAARPGTRIEATAKNKKNKKAQAEAVGQVEKVKGAEVSEGVMDQAVISGFFSPEVNVREVALGKRVSIPSTGEEGKVAGPFGKAGKCKVTFAQGISQSSVGKKAELFS